MAEQFEVLIVGAGPTGLGAAWKLDALGHRDWCLCEAGTTAGGLASSVVDEHGFTWDLGGHVQFSHYDYFDALMDELLGLDGWVYHDRQSWVWLRNRFVPYPFQLNLHRLPAAEMWECIRGLEVAQARPASQIRNFGEWIDARFGVGIARIFLRPYNEKVWAYPPEELGVGWVGERVATVDLRRVLDNIRRRRDDVSWGPNNRFRFPLRGGTGAIWRALARRLARKHPGRIRMGWRLEYLSTASREAVFSNGARIRYARLLSTVPLDVLVRSSDLAPDLEPFVRKLKYSSTHVVGVGLRGRPPSHLEDKCWMYFPESNCPFYRVTVFSRYSPHNVPDPGRFWSLMAEISESPWKPEDSSRVVPETIRGMLATGLVDSTRTVHHTWHRRLPHGYPTPFVGRDAVLGRIQPELEERGVFSRGRFGGWKYEVSNQDHSFAQGVEVVELWFCGKPERTYPDPASVNSSSRVHRGVTSPADRKGSRPDGATVPCKLL